MSVTLEGNMVEASFAATEDTTIQNNEVAEVLFQTDNTETVWGKLAIGDCVKISALTTIYFKSQAAGNLATVESVAT